MATQHNTFIRKYGDKAIIITVTDWNDFKELEKHSDKKNPDFLVGSVTSKSIYSNMLPNINVDVSNPKDITEQTKGMGISGIITGDFFDGEPLWAHRKIDGFFAKEEFSKVKIEE